MFSMLFLSYQIFISYYILFVFIFHANSIKQGIFNLWTSSLNPLFNIFEIFDKWLIKKACSFFGSSLIIWFKRLCLRQNFQI